MSRSNFYTRQLIESFNYYYFKIHVLISFGLVNADDLVWRLTNFENRKKAPSNVFWAVQEELIKETTITHESVSWFNSPKS